MLINAKKISNFGLVVFIWVCYLNVISLFTVNRLVPAHHLTIVILSVSTLTMLIGLRSTLSITNQSVVSMLIISLMIISTASQVMFNAGLIDDKGVDVNFFLLSNTMFSIIYFFLGVSLSYSSYSRKKYVLIFIVFMAPIFFLSTFYINGYTVSYGEIRANGSDDSINHLSIGSYVVVICFFLFSLLERKKKFFPAIIILVYLFVLDGRGALLATLLTLLFYSVLLFRSRCLLRFKMIIFVFLVIFISSVLTVAPFLSGDYKYEALNDSSLNARAYLMIEGMRIVPEAGVLGSVDSYVGHLGVTGAYIHNILSAWQFYGPITFLLLCVSAMRMFILSTHSLINGSKNEFFALIAIYSVISLIMFKSIHLELFWLSLGYWSFTKNRNSTSTTC